MVYYGTLTDWEGGEEHDDKRWSKGNSYIDMDRIGDIVGRYGDGVECKVALIEVSEDPTEIDFI